MSSGRVVGKLYHDRMCPITEWDSTRKGKPMEKSAEILGSILLRHSVEEGRSAGPVALNALSAMCTH